MGDHPCGAGLATSHISYCYSFLWFKYKLDSMTKAGSSWDRPAGNFDPSVPLLSTRQLNKRQSNVLYKDPLLRIVHYHESQTKSHCRATLVIYQ
jgi:hypothetical protein